MGPAVMELHNKMRAKEAPQLFKARKMGHQRRFSVQKAYRQCCLAHGCPRVSFPPPTQEIKELVREEITEVQNNWEELQLLKNVTEDLDSVIQSSINDVLKGHVYANIDIKGKAHAGDAFPKDWTGPAVGPSHTYGTVIAGESALLGNEYGGKRV
ncbi:hypothetical protein M422DRAFT_249587 [Sphaerobolus stellatus SS14]|uniref:Uncharacterized protein n=1 Tax=Sphaerobolus stellatus (strain SS14) TaxID=990650 RepID=A0A0C9W532_SPHS4|nr:hypothetical protein M422DRAFT_249587 [Sphaerobolus stellatus SS14]